MQQLLSDFYPTDNRDALFSDQPQSIDVYAFFFFYNLSLLRYRMVPFVDALAVSDTCRYRLIDCTPTCLGLILGFLCVISAIIIVVRL